MLQRKFLGASALLIAAGMVHASPNTPALTLEQPIYVAETSDVNPMMYLLNQAGVGQTLTDNGITVGGHVQVGWTYNFDRPDSQINVGRVFDFEDQDPTFHQAVVYFDKAVAYSAEEFNIGGRIEWMWGGDARLIHANGIMSNGQSADEQFDPTQFYVEMNLPVGDGLKLKFGKFRTTIGYEYIDPTQNALYSHSFMFGYSIPFTHLGVLASYQFSPEFEGYVGVVRGWDQGFRDNNGDNMSYMLGGSYVLNEQTTLYFNFITGPEQFDNSGDWRSLIDFSVEYAASDELSLAVNINVAYEADAAIDGGSAVWWGVAAYASYVVDPMFTVNGRLEYFNDDDGARGFDSGLVGATLGVAITPLPDDPIWKGLKLRPELRADFSNNDIFNDGEDDIQITFGVDAIFAF